MTKANHDVAVEQERIEALYRLEILDTLPEKEFDQLVELAAMVCNVPMSSISLIDASRQWFKAKTGFELNETARNVSFCDHTIWSVEPLIVEDALLDKRFAENQLVVGEPGIRFYAGVRVMSADQAVGAICIMDTQPRSLSESQIRALKIIGHQVAELLSVRLVSSQLSSYIEKLELSREQLRGEKESLQRSIEACFDGVIIFNENQILYASARAGEILALPSSDVLKLSDQSDSPNDFAQKLLSRFNGPGEDQFSFVTRKNEIPILNLNIRSRVIRYNNELVRIAFLRDDSNVAALVGELRETETQLQALTDNLPGAVYRFYMNPDFTMGFDYFSKGAEQIFERSRRDLVGNLNSFTKLVSPGALKSLESSFRRSFKTRTRFEWTGPICLSATAQKWLQFTAQPSVSEGGTVTWHGVIFDVTDRKRAEDALAEQQVKMLHSSKMASLGEMAAGLAHEINNAINYVSGSLPGLERIIERDEFGSDAIKAKKYFGAIKEGVRVTTEIIHSLKSYSGAKAEVVTKLNVSDAVSVIANILQPKLRKSSVRLIFAEIDPELNIISNPGALSQILINLIGNAADATPEGGQINVEARFTNECFELTVIDNGAGIDPENLAKIFDPFFTTKSVGSGTGLGLYIVQNEVARLGGKLVCQSELGVGSRFTFSLPLSAALAQKPGAA